METTPAKTPKKTAVSALTLGNADDALTLATELQKFVKANGLTSNIQGKAFPQVEAWQFAGSLLGLSTLLEDVQDKSTDNEIKWQATVQIINTRTGAVVGRGFATCSNKEHTKRTFADYAICSMAQTRAMGKAYRLALGWLMKAAGYEATPAEEVQEMGTSAVEEAQPVQMITPEQKREVLTLVSHVAFTSKWQSAVMEQVDGWDRDRADAAIENMKGRIRVYEGSNP